MTEARLRVDGDRLWLGDVEVEPAEMWHDDVIAVPRDLPADVSLPEWVGEPHRTRGARIRLPNGWEVSLIWGSLTHSDNRRDLYEQNKSFTEEPATVEIGIAYDDKLLQIPGQDDTVIGFVPVAVLPRILDEVATWAEGEARSLDAILPAPDGPA